MSEKKKHYGMVIDVRRCIGCHACTATCKIENDVPTNYYRSWVVEGDKGEYPNVSRVKLPTLCNHCEDAPCEQVCPVKATYHDENGTVLVDPERCIGCRYCVAACPYDARYLNPETGIADKCTFCVHRVEYGLEPACVSTCVGHARVFGDLNDPNSEVSRLLREHNAQTLRKDLGTKPSVYYIGLDEELATVNYNQLKKGGDR